MISIVNEIFAEGLGMFILFLIIFSNIKKTYVAIIIALLLFLILYFTYGTSQAHFNSTISITKYIAGDISLKHFIGYTIGQICGSFGALYLITIL